MERLDIKVERDRLRSMYTADIGKNTHNMMLLGGIGSGKTHMLSTAVQPVLVHSFDPGGTGLRLLKGMKESGAMLVDTSFERELDIMKTKKIGVKPDTRIYRDWEIEFDRLRWGGFFDHVGTYCIDSSTNFIHALKSEVARKNGRDDSALTQPDWQILGNTFGDVVRFCTALPCNFVLTGHLKLFKDDVEGVMIARFNIIPSLQIDLPSLFDEIYILESKTTSQGLTRKVITANTDKYEARTRIGGGVFEVREEPDIKYLLDKAGLDNKDKEIE